MTSAKKKLPEENSERDIFKSRSPYVLLAFGLSVVGGATLVYLLINPTYNDWSFHIDSELAANFGNLVAGFVGPLFSLASIFLLYETLRAQRSIFQKQSFETRFFQMLSIHRRNVSEMAYRRSENVFKDRRGRRVFEEINFQIGYVYDDLKKKLGSKLAEDDLINISYLTVFFGPEQLLTTCAIYVKKYKKVEPELTRFLNHIRSIKTQDNQIRAFTGHQIRLGHYFRHLYQSVTYIDEQSFLTDGEKKRYVKMLRSQLSTTEQITFFFNSLSTLGAPWERDHKEEPDKKFITKYQLIKNLPYDSINGIKLKEKFPGIRFEYEESFPEEFASPQSQA